MTQITMRKLPALDPDNEAFWTSGQSGRLMITRCVQCRRYQHPPLPVCPECGDDTRPEPVSGTGRVMTFSVNYQPWVPGQEVPFVLAVVELDEQEGLWIMSNIVDCAPDDVTIGMPVQVCFELQDDVWVPLFKPGAAA